MSSRKKEVDVAEFMRLAKQGLSPARLAIRFGISSGGVRKMAIDNGIKLPTVQEMRRRNGLPASRRWEPSN
jgi:hypothetical protein